MVCESTKGELRSADDLSENVTTPAFTRLNLINPCILKWRMRLVCSMITIGLCFFGKPGSAQISSSLPDSSITETAGAPAPLFSEADSSNLVQIAEINITGNRKTKDYIILREVDFHVSQTLLYSELQKKMQETH